MGTGYSLVRLLMEKMPQIKLDRIDSLTFIEQIMKPHTPYYKAVKELFGQEYLHGMAHITGGGIEGNLCRIIPDGLTAEISLPQIRPLPVFKILSCGETWRMKKCCGPSTVASALSWWFPGKEKRMQYAASPSITPAMKSEG